MIIPTITILIISLLSFFPNYSIDNNKEEFLRGNVLGVKEEVTSRQEIGNTILKAVEDIKNFKLPQLPLANDVLAESDSAKVLEKKKGATDFNLLSSNGVAIDPRSDKILFDKYSDKQWSIASITKLMTALVFLDTDPDWEEIYKISVYDKREGGIMYLFTGDEVKIKDLFYSSLVASDNVATVALVHSTGLSESDFVAKMNERAKAMGLENTIFFDSTGLHNGNVSTAKEVAILAKEAFSKKEIRDATITKEYTFTTLGGRQKKIYSTDYLLDVFPNNGIRIMGGKTGYNNSAGYCFAGKFVDGKGNEIITVVLGGEEKNTRFEQTYHLANWVYKNYNW